MFKTPLTTIEIFSGEKLEVLNTEAKVVHRDAMNDIVEVPVRFTAVGGEALPEEFQGRNHGVFGILISNPKKGLDQIEGLSNYIPNLTERSVNNEQLKADDDFAAFMTEQLEKAKEMGFTRVGQKISFNPETKITSIEVFYCKDEDLNAKASPEIHEYYKSLEILDEPYEISDEEKQAILDQIKQLEEQQAAMMEQYAQDAADNVTQCECETCDENRINDDTARDSAEPAVQS